MVNRWSSLEVLRQRAEQHVQELPPPRPAENDRDALLYELQVHATELEMQNEALEEVQRELETSHTKYRDLFDLAPIAYLQLSSDGRIELGNQAAADLLGVPRGQLTGQRFSKFIAADDAEALERHRREVLVTTDKLLVELALDRGSEGGRGEILLDSVCTDLATGRWRTAILDVSELRALSRRIDHGDRLQAIGVHVSGIAHDFNNILSSMLGYATLALSALSPDHAARGSMQRLQRVGERGSKAIRQLSSFSRTEDTNPDGVDLNAFIASSEPLFASLLGRHVEVRLRLDAVDAFVRIGAAELEQALINLVVNAEHAMPRGGILTIATEETAPRPEDPEGTLSYVRLSVSDTGIGMDAPTRARASEPFFTTKSGGQGSGLGLALTRRAVERAGGRLELESERGRGTTVILELPHAAYVRRAPTERPPKSVERNLRPGAVAIVIQEDPIVRRALCEAFKEEGWEPVPASSAIEGLDALKRYRNDPPPLLLADISALGQAVEFESAVRALVPAVTLAFTRPLFVPHQVDGRVRERALVCHDGSAHDLVRRILTPTRGSDPPPPGALKR